MININELGLEALWVTPDMALNMLINLKNEVLTSFNHILTGYNESLPYRFGREPFTPFDQMRDSLGEKVEFNYYRANLYYYAPTGRLNMVIFKVQYMDAFIIIKYDSKFVVNEFTSFITSLDDIQFSFHNNSRFSTIPTNRLNVIYLVPNSIKF